MFLGSYISIVQYKGRPKKGRPLRIPSIKLCKKIPKSFYALVDDLC